MVFFTAPGGFSHQSPARFHHRRVSSGPRLCPPSALIFTTGVLDGGRPPPCAIHLSTSDFRNRQLPPSSKPAGRVGQVFEPLHFHLLLNPTKKRQVGKLVPRSQPTKTDPRQARVRLTGFVGAQSLQSRADYGLVVVVVLWYVVVVGGGGGRGAVVTVLDSLRLR